MGIDELISQAINDAQVIYGERVALLDNPRALPSRKGNSNNIRKWTQAEDDFYWENAGSMSYDEMAKRLGRTPAAVKCHFTRRGFPAGSKMAGWLTAQKVAEMLSIDPHKTVTWIRLGILPGELMFFKEREIHRISLIRFKMWLVKPEHWIYFDARKIKNLALRSLVLRAQQRWEDEWWSTRQVADYLGVDGKDVLRQIEIGKIHGIQARHKGGRDQAGWSFWYVRKSDAIILHIPRGKGANRRNYHWPEGADRFLIRARSQGLEWSTIARMMKWGQKRCKYRYHLLKIVRVDHE